MYFCSVWCSPAMHSHAPLSYLITQCVRYSNNYCACVCHPRSYTLGKNAKVGRSKCRRDPTHFKINGTNAVNAEIDYCLGIFIIFAMFSAVHSFPFILFYLGVSFWQELVKCNVKNFKVHLHLLLCDAVATLSTHRDLVQSLKNDCLEIKSLFMTFSFFCTSRLTRNTQRPTRNYYTHNINSTKYF